jgi:hypothetical protein
MNKGKILIDIDYWQYEISGLWKERAELEKKILEIDIKLNYIMSKYDKLCRKLINN